MEAAAVAQLNAGQKRKRSELDESDAKLKEFLEVMQPAAKSKAWAAQAEDSEPPTKIQAIEIPDGESDGEYEAIPKTLRAKSPPKSIVLPEPSPVVSTTEPAQLDEIVADASGPAVTDDEWMRSRTNRLLDLVDPDDIVIEQGATPKATADVVEEQIVKQPNGPDKDELPDLPDTEEVEIEEEIPDPTIEAIKSSGRLFVRNLAYTATEQELREHFEVYGSLDEVRMHLSIFLLSPLS